MTAGTGTSGGGKRRRAECPRQRARAASKSGRDLVALIGLFVAGLLALLGWAYLTHRGPAGSPSTAQVGTATGGAAAGGAAAGTLPRSGTPLPPATVVFSTDHGDGRILATLGVTDGVLQLLSTAGGPSELPALSPDRSTILYVRESTRQLRVVGADGSGDRPLFTTGPGSQLRITADARPAWSPDGRSIVVFADGPGPPGLYVVGIDGAVARRLPTQARVGDPAWSPDGKLIVYWASPTGDGGSLWTVPASGAGTPARLTDGGAGIDADPAWSPDGRLIAFRHAEGGAAGNRDVWIMNADGTGRTRLTTDPRADQDPSWSPDGKQIAFSSERDGNREIYLMDADGTNQRRLTFNPLVDSAPAWR